MPPKSAAFKKGRSCAPARGASGNTRLQARTTRSRIGAPPRDPRGGRGMVDPAVRGGEMTCAIIANSHVVLHGAAAGSALPAVLRPLAPAGTARVGGRSSVANRQPREPPPPPDSLVDRPEDRPAVGAISRGP